MWPRGIKYYSLKSELLKRKNAYICSGPCPTLAIPWKASFGLLAAQFYLWMESPKPLACDLMSKSSISDLTVNFTRLELSSKQSQSLFIRCLTNCMNINNSKRTIWLMIPKQDTDIGMWLWCQLLLITNNFLMGSWPSQCFDVVIQLPFCGDSHHKSIFVAASQLSLYCCYEL